MKRNLTLLLIGLLLVSQSVFGQKDLQSVPALRKFSQQGWKIQHAHYSFDSLTIYFSALEPGKKNYDLFVTRSHAGVWGAPERLSDAVNSDADELWPSVSSDERFVSDNLRGEWQASEPSIIATAHDLSPLIMPDNQTVIYARRETEKKRQYYALLHTRYLGFGVWTLPVRVDSLERRSLFGPYLKQEGDTVL